MKDEKPSTPVFANLNLPVTETVPPKPEPTVSRKRTALCKPSRAGQVRRVLDPKASAIRFTSKVSRMTKTSWQRIKGGLQVRLAHLNAAQLKRLLVACGVAATTALVIIALAKHWALIFVLLAVLGAVVVIKLWNRILTLGI
jgi:hypothetical protein